jgi:hypothetical protein
MHEYGLSHEAERRRTAVSNIAETRAQGRTDWSRSSWAVFTAP